MTLSDFNVFAMERKLRRWSKDSRADRRMYWLFLLYLTGLVISVAVCIWWFVA